MGIARYYTKILYYQLESQQASQDELFHEGVNGLCVFASLWFKKEKNARIYIMKQPPQQGRVRVWVGLPVSKSQNNPES